MPLCKGDWVVLRRWVIQGVLHHISYFVLFRISMALYVWLNWVYLRHSITCLTVSVNHNFRPRNWLELQSQSIITQQLWIHSNMQNKYRRESYCGERKRKLRFVTYSQIILISSEVLRYIFIIIFCFEISFLPVIASYCVESCTFCWIINCDCLL